MKPATKPLVLLLFILLLTAPLFAIVPEDGRFPKDSKIAVVQEYLNYFMPDYRTSRADFLKRADDLSKIFDGTELMKIQVPTQLDQELFIDIFYIPPVQSTANLLVISCGTHGVEGLAGSAVQRMVMDRYLKSGNLGSTGVLLIHALNPYGFNYIRRVTENNVDMNRNCEATPTLFATKNEGYAKLYDFINPAGPASLGSLSNQFFVERAILKILKASMPVLRQAVLQGQYTFPEGLYFGGSQFEPQVVALKPILTKYAGRFDKVIHIDLHTGYGERGKMHLFPNPAQNQEVKAGTETLFEGYSIDWGDSKDFYTITGDFSSLIGKMIPGKLVIPMTLEFGTMDSQKTMGSLRSIQNMILENQGFHHGYKNKRSERKIKEWILEMYAPSSSIWKTEIMDQSVKIMGQVFDKIK